MAGTVSAMRCLVVLPDFRGAGQGKLRIPSVRPAKKVVQNRHNAPHTCIHSAYTVVEFVSPAVGRDGNSSVSKGIRDNGTNAPASPERSGAGLSQVYLENGPKSQQTNKPRLSNP